MDTKESQAIQALLDYATEIVPAGMAFTVDSVPLALCLGVSCDGADSTFGYQCVCRPGHLGKCYSHNKGVYFERKN